MLVNGYQLSTGSHLRAKFISSLEGNVQFLSNNFVLLATYIIGAFANYSLERHTRIDFLQKRTIEAEKNKVNSQRVAIQQQANELFKVIAS